MKRLLIFDFDGTLVDTITDVGICFNKALQANDLPQHPLERFGSFAGGNLETVVSKMLPQGQVTEENITRVKTAYRSLYLNSDKPNTKPYPGMMALLEELKDRKYTIAINSNKGQALLDDMVSKMFPPDFFDAVVGYREEFPSKPDPYGISQICLRCGYRLEDAVYIGDGKSDLDTAANAGIPCIIVRWGQGRAADYTDQRAIACVESSQQLREWLLGEHS